MTDALYQTTSTAWGGRAGRTASQDGKLDFQLSVPAAMGGDDGPGTNPEQLFATGYAACFHGALKLLAGKSGVNADDSSVTATVKFLKDGDGFKIGAVIQATIPHADQAQAQELLEATHKFCPYSKATAGNIDVDLQLVSEED